MKRCVWYLLFFLLISFLTQGQVLTKEQNSFLKKGATSVCTDNIAKADWSSLNPSLKNKKIILLGEPNHGSKEISLLRNSLIAYLHKTLGIKTILLESGIGELITIDLNKKELSGSQMTNDLFGGWRTKEFVEMMNYIKSENLSIAGFDVQRTGGSFNFLLRGLASKRSIDSTYYVNLEIRYGQVARALTGKGAVYDSLKTNTKKLVSDYQILSEQLTKATDGSKVLELSIVTIKNRVTFLTYMLNFLKDRNWNNRWAARDSAMAGNVQWLIENLYPNEPVIVIAHNFHIAKFNEKESVMGEILSAKYNDRMYSLGFFGGEGSFHDNFLKEVVMLPADSVTLDIKHVIKGLPGKVSFIDIQKKKQKGWDWLDVPIVVNDTFIDLSSSNKMILSKHFDGLVLIDKISPSENN